MDKHLVLFTRSFPYGTGEPFLVPELEALSQTFAHITIIPMTGIEVTRKVPPNVTVERPLWGSQSTRYIFYLSNFLGPRTLALLFGESWRAVIVCRRLHVAVFYRIWLWAMYRATLERSSAVRWASASPETTVAYSYWGQAVALGIPKLSHAGVPCVVRYHRVDLYLDGMSAESYIHRKAKYFPWRAEVEFSSRISLFVSEHGRRYFGEQWPSCSFSRKVINRLGVADRGCRHPRSEAARIILVASCSSVTPHKRVPLIATFVSALAKHKPVCWHHFGTGDLDEVRRALAGAPPELEAKLWGWLDNEYVLKFYGEHHVDLFLNFSTTEGVPVSIMEALSFDIPAVATAVGGTPEAVVDGESGLLISVDDCEHPQDLAERVFAEIRPGGVIARARPREHWRRNFNAEVNCVALARLLGALADKNVALSTQNQSGTPATFSDGRRNEKEGGACHY